MRNPWARTLSAYHFLMKGGLNEMDYTFAENHLKQYVSFEDFILNGLEKKEVQEWVHFIPQYKFIYDKKGKLLVNFIGRLEDIDNDFKVISQKINKNAQLSHLNKNRNSNVDIYTNIYTIEMKDIVKRVYDRDIELFEYKFN